MAQAAMKPREGRALLYLPDAETFSDHLGDFGEAVPPRPRARADQVEKEAWCLRRLLVAWRKEGSLRFPIVVRAGRADAAEPDFVLSMGGRSPVGIEVTEATDEAWQAELTQEARARSVREADEFDVELLSEDGIVPREEAPNALALIETALDAKEARAADGGYRGCERTDLLIYVNYKYGPLLKAEDLVAVLRPGPTTFHAIHIILNEAVILDALSDDLHSVDVRTEYDVDLYAWSFDQAVKARAGEVAALDLANIAEELESMARRDLRKRNSQMRRLLTHLLKYSYQPQRRTRSWVETIGDARSEIDDVIELSPSLDPRRLRSNERAELLTKTYDSAARTAATQTRLPRKAFPPDCPFTLDQILDPEFLPDREPK